MYFTSQSLSIKYTFYLFYLFILLIVIEMINVMLIFYHRDGIYSDTIN